MGNQKRYLKMTTANEQANQDSELMKL